MVKLSEQLRLALEARQALAVLDEGGGQDLDRHVAAELGVLGAIDLAHAALAELGGDAIVGDRPADQLRGQGPSGMSRAEARAV
jgi:hypothetical protein